MTMRSCRVLFLLASAAAQQPPTSSGVGAQTLYRLLELGKAVSGENAGGTAADGAADPAAAAAASPAAGLSRVLSDPAQRASVQALIGAMLQPGAAARVVAEAERVLGPQTPAVLEDVQRIEDSAAKLRARWGADAPKFVLGGPGAPPLPAAAAAAQTAVAARLATGGSGAPRARRHAARRRAARPARQPVCGGDGHARRGLCARRRGRGRGARRRRAPAAAIDAALTRLQAQATATARRDWEGAARSAGRQQDVEAATEAARDSVNREAAGLNPGQPQTGYAQQYAKLLNTLATPRARRRHRRVIQNSVATFRPSRLARASWPAKPGPA